MALAGKGMHQIFQSVELARRAQQLALKQQVTTTAKVTGAEFSIVDVDSVAKAWLNSMAELTRNPLHAVLAVQSAWTNSYTAWMGALSGDGAKTKDRRFKDKAWDEDPLSRGLRDSYLSVEAALDQLLSALPAGSKDHLRTQFYSRQLLSMLSPANFAPTNPVVRKKLFETEGQSILDGFKNLLDDLERGDGRLDINTNDRDAFVVGRDLATTPGKVVYQNEMMQLIQYEPLTDKQRKRPILFVPAWINKYYILDLRPDNSLVRFLLERGHSVFVISWVNPTSEHAEKDFGDYMKLGPLAAIDAIEKATGEQKINLLGFCIGGILVTATLAWLAARGEATKIGCATTLATMVDFTDVGEIGVFIDQDRVTALRDHMKNTGYLENHHMQDMFSMIRENDLIWSYHVANYLLGGSPPAFDLLFWNSDSTRMPAAMLLWYIERIYLANGLRQPGYLELDGTPIDISKIKTPMYVLGAKEDHIAPWKSVYPTTGLVGGEIQFVLAEAGHIAGVINPPSKRSKYGFFKNADYSRHADDWLSDALYHEGSWWGDWAEWLEAKDRAKHVPARVPGDSLLEVIEEAPGSYVVAP